MTLTIENIQTLCCHWTMYFGISRSFWRNQDVKNFLGPNINEEWNSVKAWEENSSLWVPTLQKKSKETDSLQYIAYEFQELWKTRIIQNLKLKGKKWKWSVQQ